MTFHSPIPVVRPLIEAVLVGSTSAHVDGRPFNFSPWRARSGVIPRVARHLIAEGRDPKTVLRVTRNGTVVFQDATLEAWAKLTFEESDTQSIRRRPYRAWNDGNDLVGGDGQGQAEDLEVFNG